MSWHISSISTYPIKGLVGQNHETIFAQKDGLLQGDRAYGLTSGTAESQKAPSDSWLKKAHFLQMMSIADLAALTLDFDADTQMLRLHKQGDDSLFYEGVLSDEADGARLCALMANYLNLPETAPRPRLFHLPLAGLTDTKTPYVAFGNTASITDFATAENHGDDSRRYRLNVMMTGAPAWAEFSLLGKTARLGSCEFTFAEPVGRCAAIEVDPKTAQRQKGLVQQLSSRYGHTDMGIFATVTREGYISVGDELTILD